MRSVNTMAELLPLTDGRTADGRLAISVEEAGKLLGIGRNLAYQMVQRGELRNVRLGNRRLIPVNAILEMLGEAA